MPNNSALKRLAALEARAHAGVRPVAAKLFDGLSREDLEVLAGSEHRKTMPPEVEAIQARYVANWHALTEAERLLLLGDQWLTILNR